MSSSYKVTQCKFDIQQTEKFIAISLNGVLHPVACQQLCKQIIPQACSLNLPVVIDLTDISRIVSNLLALLIEIKNQPTLQNPISIICDESTDISKLLFWSGINEFFSVYNTMNMYELQHFKQAET